MPNRFSGAVAALLVLCQNKYMQSGIHPTPAGHGAGSVLHLSHGGTSVVIDATGPVPVIVYWGEALGDASAETLESLALAARPQRVSGGLTETGRLSVAATAARGWFGTPVVEGHRAGAASSLEFTTAAVRFDAHSATFALVDREAELDLDVEIVVGSGGLVRQRLELANTGADDFTVNSLLASFPLPWDAAEILDTTGRHLRERSAQRRDLTFGTHLRESRRGRPGADATLLLAAGRRGFGFESGRVHGIHVAWSGNHRALAERVPTGEALLAGGELYGPGEIVLAPGERIATPWVIGSWGDGLDELAHRFHDEQRRRPQHPHRPRPVTLNSWEAVYFDHGLERLGALAEAAARVGVERFVLDDGWFLGRRDDTAGLGDWEVDAEVWPDGLQPLIDLVHAHGMEFGLWVEPEMVNLDSDLARAHPDWILRGRTSLPPVGRQQHVLDLSNPEAYARIRERLLALLDEYDIAYLKWDHNRDLADAGSGPRGSARVHAHTLALYRLLDELKAAHPSLEIESCASGGARVDLGILERTDRIWVSDTLDPIERLENQRHTSLVVPPELMGMHLTSPIVHSTGRVVDLDLSGAVALFGHFGIEWDLSALDEAGLERVAAWVALAKRVRPLVATGRTVNVDGTDAGVDVRGMVSPDGDHGVFTIAQTATTVAYPPGRVRLPGLDPDRVYRVELLVRPTHDPAQSPLAWAETELRLTGRQLATVGLRPPVQFPQQAAVVEATAVD